MNLIQKINKLGYKWDGTPNLPKTKSINKRVFFMLESLRVKKSRGQGDTRWYGWLRAVNVAVIALVINLPIFLIGGGLWFLLSLPLYFIIYCYAWYYGEIEMNTHGAYYHHRDADIRDYAVFIATTIIFALCV